MKNLERILKALANKRRLEIMRCLKEKGNVCQRTRGYN